MTRNGNKRGSSLRRAISIPLGIAVVVTVLVGIELALRAAQSPGGLGTCQSAILFGGIVCLSYLCLVLLLVETVVIGVLWALCLAGCSADPDGLQAQCRRLCNVIYGSLLFFAVSLTLMLCGAFGGASVP